MNKQALKAQVTQGLLLRLLAIPLATNLEDATSLFDQAILIESYGYQKFGMEFYTSLYQVPEQSEEENT